MLIRIIYILFILIIVSSCEDSDYVNIKVKKSAFMADKYELERDSLITNGIRICTSAQRFYHKSTFIGGGGNSFIGYSIPAHLRETSYGNYSITIKDVEMKVIGVGKIIGYDGINNSQVEFIADTATINFMSIIN
jgi:hypothetical protein